MSNNIQFRLAVWTEPAGKYNPDAPQEGNEDNYYIDDDITDTIPGHFVQDGVITLSKYGCIMAVADGMGGMNAGEVASEIATNTVKNFFSPGVITDVITATPESRSKYLEQVIVEANRRIISDAKENPEHEGMGSTLILAWLVKDELTVTWIGDSRCYRYNPKNGLQPLSEDHSYVQDLVKKGILKYEQTFGHPQGNIVTRSLGDDSQKCQPESRQFKVYNSDVILLCSDGLSGVLRDQKTCDENNELYPGENIEDIISENLDSMSGCRERLFSAAEQANWYDNVTVILCQITSGAGEAPLLKDKKTASTKIEEPITDPDERQKPFWERSVHIKTKHFYSVLAAIVLLALLVFVYIFVPSSLWHNGESSSESKDSIQTQSVVPEGEEEVKRKQMNDQISAIIDSLSLIINRNDLQLIKVDDLRDKFDISSDTLSAEQCQKVIEQLTLYRDSIEHPLDTLYNSYTSNKSCDTIAKNLKVLIRKFALKPDTKWKSELNELTKNISQDNKKPKVKQEEKLEMSSGLNITVCIRIGMDGSFAVWEKGHVKDGTQRKANSLFDYIQSQWPKSSLQKIIKDGQEQDIETPKYGIGDSLICTILRPLQ